MLLKTVHGSFLYGTGHAGSDRDFYVVVEPTGKRKHSKQTIVNGIDTNVVDLPTFLRYAGNGVPQALEAMWSPLAEFDAMPWRWNYFAGTEARDRFDRTIKSFILQEDYKHKRHGLRLALELKSLLRYGQFNPIMKPHQVEWTDFVASTFNAEDCLEIAIETAYQ